MNLPYLYNCTTLIMFLRLSSIQTSVVINSLSNTGQHCFLFVVLKSLSEENNVVDIVFVILVRSGSKQ